ncbi:MAG: tetratricopeptide repeat protein [Treponema sp.]|nr:tetratricopeptide repeat protein [Treponema sp.]
MRTISHCLKMKIQSRKTARKPLGVLVLFLITVLFFPVSFFLFSCASSGNVSAEEYFSIGMAYYDMGKYAEAEQWLNKAMATDKTLVASEYNLGRIAFETGRYEEAARHFENILKTDPVNLMALKAAAYSRIKNGDLKEAEALYNRVLALVPESSDDGYNYALILYSLKKYDNCEEVLNRYPYALEENASSILLLARAQKAQNKVEAADSYAKWTALVTGTPDPQGLYEYAQVLESAGFYARSLEQYKAAIDALTTDTDTLKKSQLLFEEARLILTVDPENSDGITELNKSVAAGFSDITAMQTLMADDRLSAANKSEIGNIVSSMANTIDENAAANANDGSSTTNADDANSAATTVDESQQDNQ